MIDDLFSSFRVYRALRGGAWRRLEFNEANGGTGFWTRNVQPENDRLVVAQEFYTPFDPTEFSDGYHTVEELYLHRHHLYCMVLGTRPDAWKARAHYDGSSYPGWFVAGCDLHGKAISYHMPDELWDLCPANTLELGREFDGHSSGDVLKRMTAFLQDQCNRIGE